MSDFIATFIDVKRIGKIPEEIMPFVDFKIAMEGRSIKGDERVAIFNVATTSSYVVVFLDPEKTLEDVEEELKKESFVRIDAESRRIIKGLLRK